MAQITGLAFDYKGKFPDILRALVTCEPSPRRVWAVDYLWVEGPASDTYEAMNGQTYSWQELLRKFSELGKSWVYFARLRGYDAQSDITPITTFDDFSASSCALILFVVDFRCYEIYGKDAEEVLAIQSSLASMLSVDTERMPAEDIGRVRLTL